MVALASGRLTPAKEIDLKSYPMKKGDTIYKGSMVVIKELTGFVEPAGAVKVADEYVVGVADETVVSPTTDTSGDKKIRVRSGRAFQFAGASLTQAHVGDLMYATDDQTLATVATGDPPLAGILVEFISATLGWVFIPLGGASSLIRPAPVSSG